MSWIVLTLLRAYKWLVSPLVGPACRYVPSCSEYAMEAVARYGVVKGGWKAAWRLARCHPLARGGFDPVVSCQLPVASGNKPDVGDVHLTAAQFPRSAPARQPRACRGPLRPRTPKPGVPGTPLKESTS